MSVGDVEGMVMGVRADERMAVKRGQVSQPDRVRLVLGLLEAGPHFRFREDEDVPEKVAAPVGPKRVQRGFASTGGSGPSGPAESRGAG